MPAWAQGVDSWLPRPRLHTRSAVFFYRPARQILQPLESFRLCLRRLWDQGSDSDLLTHQRVEIHEVRPMGRSLFSKMTYQWVAPPWMNQKKCDAKAAPQFCAQLEEVLLFRKFRVGMRPAVLLIDRPTRGSKFEGTTYWWVVTRKLTRR